MIGKIYDKQVIFDLDGTLVDSEKSILASMLAAFNDEGIKLTNPLTPEIIGPPLPVAMASLLGEANVDRIPRLIKAFKRHYDHYGYMETRIFEGVPEMLKDLRELGCSLYIATNKRILPTSKIVDFIGWTDLFDGVYSLDSFGRELPNKVALLQQLALELTKTSQRKIYIGDRVEDGVAARKNGFQFIAVSWGYESFALGGCGYTCVESPAQIVRIVKKIWL